MQEQLLAGAVQGKNSAVLAMKVHGLRVCAALLPLPVLTPTPVATAALQVT